MRRILGWLNRALGRMSRLPEGLNWLLSVVEPLIVLGTTVSVSYGVWCLVRPDVNGRQTRIIASMKDINDNWKAGVLLLVLLFYRTVRVFLEQAEEAFGVKRQKLLPGTPLEESNPKENP